MTSFRFRGEWAVTSFSLFPSFYSIGVINGIVKFRTTRLATLEENVAAASVSLTAEETAHIRSLVDAASCHGTRYPPAHALGLFADTPTLEEYKPDSTREAIVGAVYERAH